MGDRTAFACDFAVQIRMHKMYACLCLIIELKHLPLSRIGIMDRYPKDVEGRLVYDSTGQLATEVVAQGKHSNKTRVWW
jgi:hypothetical protein